MGWSGVEVEVGWGERQDHRLCLNVAGEHGKSILYVIVVRQCLVVIVVFRCQRSPLRNLLRKGVVSSFSCMVAESGSHAPKCEYYATWLCQDHTRQNVNVTQSGGVDLLAKIHI